MKPELKELYDLALAVRENAHCPISGFKVGVAVRGNDGKTYAGCNVESITFNNSTHAEMNAIDTAIANGTKEIAQVVVVIDTATPMFPCALCRQKIIEFGRDAEVIAANLAGEVRSMQIGELYPEPFTSI